MVHFTGVYRFGSVPTAIGAILMAVACTIAVACTVVRPRHLLYRCVLNSVWLVH